MTSSPAAMATPLTDLERRILRALWPGGCPADDVLDALRVVSRRRTGCGWIASFGEGPAPVLPERALFIAHPALPLDGVAYAWFRKDGTLDYLEAVSFDGSDWPYESEDLCVLAELEDDPARRERELAFLVDGLRRLIDDPPRDADDLGRWYERAQDFRDELAQSQVDIVPTIVWHFLSDADIRLREPEYARLQLDAVRDAIAGFERAARVVFARGAGSPVSGNP